MSDSYVAPDRLMAKQLMAERIRLATSKPAPIQVPVTKVGRKPVPAPTERHVPKKLPTPVKPRLEVSFGIPESSPAREALLHDCKNVVGAEGVLADFDKRTAANERTS